MASMIGEAEIKKLARLARLSLSPEEIPQLGRDLEAILKYVSQLKEVSATARDDKLGSDLKNIWREDSVSPELCRPQDGHTRVKKILG